MKETISDIYFLLLTQLHWTEIHAHEDEMHHAKHVQNLDFRTGILFKDAQNEHHKNIAFAIRMRKTQHYGPFRKLKGYRV